jgi:hypothetical protein
MAKSATTVDLDPLGGVVVRVIATRPKVACLNRAKEMDF